MTRGSPTVDLNRLRQEHAELTSLARQLSLLVAQSVPPQASKLYELRMRLTSALIRHLKMEDWVLYPSLLQSSNEQVAITARSFSAGMGGLAGDFGDYVKLWDAQAIESDWKGYQRATVAILQSLALRISREDRDLYSLIETERERLKVEPELRYAQR